MANTPEQVTERRRGSGVKVVYDTLRDEILDLTLTPGSPVDEVQLAERFGMSRTPIREALVRLAGEGLVTTLSNRTTIISNIDLLNLNAFFDALTLMYRVTMRLAAQHHRKADLVKIRACQAEFTTAMQAGNALTMIATNREFHMAIAEAGRNPYFHALCMRVLDDGRRLLRIYYQSYDDQLPQEYVGEHNEMIDAIVHRDLHRADALAQVHADQIVRQIRKLFADDVRQTIEL